MLSRYSARLVSPAPRYTTAAAAVGDVLFFKKSLTSLALKSFTGTWCSGCDWAGVAVVVAVVCGGPDAFACLAPQTLAVGGAMGCWRPASLVGVLAPELRLA